MVGDGFPKIVYLVGLSRRHDVVVDSSHFTGSVLVFDKRGAGHDPFCVHYFRSQTVKLVTAER